jgi:hypothetical protein
VVAINHRTGFRPTALVYATRRSGHLMEETYQNYSATVKVSIQKFQPTIMASCPTIGDRWHPSRVPTTIRFPRPRPPRVWAILKTNALAEWRIGLWRPETQGFRLHSWLSGQCMITSYQGGLECEPERDPDQKKRHAKSILPLIPHMAGIWSCLKQPRFRSSRIYSFTRAKFE